MQFSRNLAWGKRKRKRKLIPKMMWIAAPTSIMAEIPAASAAYVS